MSGPRRVIDADDEFERELIRSAHADKPRDRTLQRVLVGLGVGISGVAGASPVAAGSQLGVAALLKWLASGMALGIVTSGGVHVAGRALDHRIEAGTTGAPGSPIRLTAPRNAALTVAPPPEKREPPAEVGGVRSAEPSPSRTPVSAEAWGPRPLGSSSSKPVAPASRAFPLEDARVTSASLANETRLLGAVQRALASGKATWALSELASYERAFPEGALRPEASVLRVRALVAAGDRTGAEALGKRIIAGAPDSEHADAVRAALAPKTNP